MRAMAHQISVLALGAVLAVMPQAVAAQPRRTASQTQGLNDAAAQAIAPNLGDNTVLTTGDTNRDNGAQAVIQQDEAIGANPYTPFSYDNDVTYTQADGCAPVPTAAKRRPTAQVAITARPIAAAIWRRRPIRTMITIRRAAKPR
jgi:hypothetical protein